MQYDKLQLGCLLIVLYVAFIYVRERYAYKIKKKEPVFAWLWLWEYWKSLWMVLPHTPLTIWTVCRLW